MLRVKFTGRPKKMLKNGKKSKKIGGVGEFLCQYCDYQATQKISLIRHLQVHGGKKYICDCGKTYRWEIDLRRHKESAHSQLTFPCPAPDCDYLGQSQRNLAAHMKSKHSRPRPELVCEICGSQFTSSHYKEVHIKSKHLGQKEVCLACGEDFATKTILQRHVKEKHTGGTIKCDFWDKMFYQEELQGSPREESSRSNRRDLKIRFGKYFMNNCT